MPRISKMLNFARSFHEKFSLPIRKEPCIPDDSHYLRTDLLQEELDELKEACSFNDLDKVLDAVCDLRVVLDGTVLEFGMEDIYEEALEEVERSNLSKLGLDGEPVLREDGKVLKGPNYFPPNFNGLLNKLTIE